MSASPEHPDGAAAARARSAIHRRPSLIVSAISNWAAVATGIVVGLALTPFIIAQLGPVGHGVWVLIGTILLPLGLLELGVPAAVSRQTAFHAARGEYAEVSRTVSSAFAFFVVGGMLIAAFGVLAGGALARFFKVAPGQAGEFRLAVALLGLAVAINLVGQVFRAAIQGHELFVVRNTIAIVSHLLRAGLTVALLLAGHGLLGVAIASLVADFVVFVTCVIYVRLRLPAVRVRLSRARWRAFWPLVTFGLTTFVIAGADVLRGQLNIAVAGRMIGLEAVSVYGVAFLLLRYYAKVIFSGFGVLTPRLSALAGLDDHSRARRLLARSLWVCSILSGVGAVLLLALGGDFVRVWVRKAGYEMAPVVLMITAGAVYFELAQYPAVQALYALNRHRFLAIIRVIEGGMNLGLSVALAPSLGLAGVAIGMAGPMALFSGVVQPIYIARLVGLSGRQYAAPLFTCAAVAAGMLLAWHGLVRWRVPHGSYLAIAVAGLGLATLCLLLAWIGSKVGRRISGRRLALGIWSQS